MTGPTGSETPNHNSTMVLISQKLFEKILQLPLAEYQGKEDKIYIVSYTDCDSFCAAEILCSFFRDRKVKYTHLFAANVDDLFDLNYSPSMDTLFLINCGGQVNLLEHESFVCNPHLTIYVIDRHLPHHKILIEDPDRIVLFDMQNGESSSQKGVHYHSSASMILHNVLDAMRCANDKTMWLALVGTSQLYMDKYLTFDEYNREVTELYQCVERDMYTGAELKLLFDGKLIGKEEYCIPFLEHWSLYEAIRHHETIVGSLGTWNDKHLHLNDFWLHMGIRLIEARERWTYTHQDLRRRYYGNLESVLTTLRIPLFKQRQFVRHWGYGMQLTAAEMVECIHAVLMNPSYTWLENCLSVSLLLSSNRYPEDAITKAISFRETILQHIKPALPNIKKYTFFYYLELHTREQNLNLFNHPSTLLRFGHYLQSSLTFKKKNKTLRQPLVIVLFDTDSALITGVEGNTSKNTLFPLMFAETLTNTEIKMWSQSNDRCSYRMKIPDARLFIQEIQGYK